jgi:hypothetical protein
VTLTTPYVPAWHQLRDAFGPATEVPRLLARVVSARGEELAEAIGELRDHTLHQGTIYSASPAVVRAILAFSAKAEARERLAYYGLLVEFMWSAQQALAEGSATSCRSGDDPIDGAAIRDDLVAAHRQFVADLAHPLAGVRAAAAELATAFPEVPEATTRQVRERYYLEADAQVRRSVIDGLVRVRSHFSDWPEFLADALEREEDGGIRFVLSHAQVMYAGPHAESQAVAELAAGFARVYGSYEMYLGGERFFEAVRRLGAEREREAMLSALGKVTGRGAMLILAERLLRLVFADQRTDWGHVYPAGPCRIEYAGVAGDAPVLPEVLSAAQRAVLLACAEKAALWQFQTNLWQLFGLPENADGLRQYTAGHDAKRPR